MATMNDPRAAGFDADAFRDAIVFAQTMGTPDAISQRVGWVFLADHDYQQEDPIGNPYDWTAPATTTVGEDKVVEVPVAVEFVSRSSQARDTALGFMMPSHASIYVLDTYVDQVKEANHVLIDENIYEIRAWLPPMALFSVTVHSCLVEARDES